jgi:peptide-methionine (S)-S-oxide reductase
MLCLTPRCIPGPGAATTGFEAFGRKENAMMRIKPALFLLTSLLACTPGVMAAKAVFAGGCFWCMESDFERLSGVTDVISGFTGGISKDPTYNGDHEGHYEAVEVSYDPDRISYRELLDHFWVNIDPFDAGGQFCDRGSSYLSAIFVADDRERQLAEESRHKVAARFPDRKVVTPILEASVFYPIRGEEIYHQDYYKNNPIRYWCYRWTCGRDKRLKAIWGDRAVP